MTPSTPLRAALTRVLNENSMQIVADLTEMLGATLATQTRGEGELDWFRTSIQGNVEAIVHLLAYPEDLDYAEVPVGAISLVHRYARRGLPLYEVLQAYHLCELRWQQVCMEHLAKLTDDADELVAETVTLSALVHSYLDRVCQRISAEYDVERARWTRHEESTRADQVLALLDGTASEISAAEQVLGYRLRQRHVAAIAWRAGPEDSAGDLPMVQRAVAHLTEHWGATGTALVIARDYTHVWAWCGLPAEAALDFSALQAIADAAPNVRVAIGEPGSGLQGFVESHRQAAAAYEVARVPGSAGPAVVPYREVSSLTFLCADLPRAQQWVAETLGGLAVDGRRENELRHTLAVYCATHRSPVATARALNCHKNTVLFRLNSAEQVLGRPVAEMGLELDLAVRACEWLGPRVLSAAATSL